MNELKKLLTIIDSTLSKEDLIKAFQLVLVIILETEEGNKIKGVSPLKFNF
jgi:hypothetical protein